MKIALMKQFHMFIVNCMTFKETKDENNSDCQLIWKEITKILVLYLTTREIDTQESRQGSINDKCKKKKTKD